MAYEKNTWQTGDVITATKLNHMEDGIANEMPTNGLYAPLCKIYGDYAIGDTIDNWGQISQYVYNDEGSLVLQLLDNSKWYFYIINGTGVSCLNEDNNAPIISVSGDGTIVEE